MKSDTIKLLLMVQFPKYKCAAPQPLHAANNRTRDQFAQHYTDCSLQPIYNSNIRQSIFKLVAITHVSQLKLSLCQL